MLRPGAYVYAAVSEVNGCHVPHPSVTQMLYLDGVPAMGLVTLLFAFRIFAYKAHAFDAHMVDSFVRLRSVDGAAAILFLNGADEGGIYGNGVLFDRRYRSLKAKAVC